MLKRVAAAAVHIVHTIALRSTLIDSFADFASHTRNPTKNKGSPQGWRNPGGGRAVGPLPPPNIWLIIRIPTYYYWHRQNYSPSGITETHPQSYRYQVIKSKLVLWHNQMAQKFLCNPYPAVYKDMVISYMSFFYFLPSLAPYLSFFAW